MANMETCGERTMLIKGDYSEIILREERPGLLVVEIPVSYAVDPTDFTTDLE